MAITEKGANMSSEDFNEYIKSSAEEGMKFDNGKKVRNLIVTKLGSRENEKIVRDI